MFILSKEFRKHTTLDNTPNQAMIIVDELTEVSLRLGKKP